MLRYMVYRKRNSEFKLCQNDNSFFGIDIGELLSPFPLIVTFCLVFTKLTQTRSSFEPYRQLLHSYQHTKVTGIVSENIVL